MRGGGWSWWGEGKEGKKVSSSSKKKPRHASPTSSPQGQLSQLCFPPPLFQPAVCIFPERKGGKKVIQINFRCRNEAFLLRNMPKKRGGGQRKTFWNFPHTHKVPSPYQSFLLFCFNEIVLSSSLPPPPLFILSNSCGNFPFPY